MDERGVNRLPRLRTAWDEEGWCASAHVGRFIFTKGSSSSLLGVLLDSEPSASSRCFLLLVTMSASQSPRPPGAASTAVCGLYTLMPWLVSRSNVCCCEFASVRDLRPRKMMGWYATIMEVLSAIASSATAFVRSIVRRRMFDWRREGTKGASRRRPVLSQELSARAGG